MHLGLPEKKGNYKNCDKWRQIFWNMKSKTMQDHNNTQHQNGIHGAVFQIDVFFDAFDITNRHLSNYQSSKSITEQDKRHRKRESKSAQNSVN